MRWGTGTCINSFNSSYNITSLTLHPHLQHVHLPEVLYYYYSPVMESSEVTTASLEGKLFHFLHPPSTFSSASQHHKHHESQPKSPPQSPSKSTQNGTPTPPRRPRHNPPPHNRGYRSQNRRQHHRQHTHPFNHPHPVLLRNPRQRTRHPINPERTQIPLLRRTQ